MKTYTNFVDGTFWAQPIKTANLKEHSVIVDFSLQNLDAGDGDVLQTLRIPEGSWVLMVYLRVIKRSPANSTVHLGYGEDVNFWGNALPLDALGRVPCVAVETEGGNIQIYNDRAPLSKAPVYFDADDTIDIKATIDRADVNITRGRVQVCALFWDTGIKI